MQNEKQKMKTRTYGIGVLGACPAISPKGPAEEKME